MPPLVGKKYLRHQARLQKFTDVTHLALKDFITATDGDAGLQMYVIVRWKSALTITKEVNFKR